MTVSSEPKTARISAPLRRIEDLQLMNDQQRAQAYEAAKRRWAAQNPAATAEQYEAAVQGIARRLGV
jgi:hypothetical protein